MTYITQLLKSNINI